MNYGLILLVFCFTLTRLKCQLDEYEQYLISFNKSIDRLFDNARIKKFGESIALIRSFNEMNVSFKLGLNAFCDELTSEIDQMFSPMENAAISFASFANSRFGALEASPSLDWSSSDNPYHYSLASDGRCGGCWAFVATSSAEIALKIALFPIKETIPKRESVNSIPQLSAQELIDCDAFNKGCSGGNPLLAFQYIITSGVSSEYNYPFKETEEKCHTNTKHNRYYIEQYNILKPQSQNTLLTELSKGPITVGVCGTGASFLYYKSGVFDDMTCCTEQNHALLLVGYGHDNALDLDYWILQNSWSVYWGEEGYIRMLRTSDDGPGMCGMAVSPVAGYGGYVRGNDTIPSIQDDWTKYVVLPMLRLYYWIQYHWKVFLIVGAVIGLFLSIVIYYSSYNIERLRRGYTSIN